MVCTRRAVCPPMSLSLTSSPDVFARPDDPELELLRSMAAMLDGLDVALCVFDTEDRTLAWNRTFLRLFPEHEGHVHVGEP